MPRPLKPWFHKKKNCWVIEPGGKLIKLAVGPKALETKKKAEAEFFKYMLTQSANPPVDGGDPTVASVIEAFLAHDEKRTCDRFFKDRKYTLQLFAEAHGWRKVKDALPYHLTSFLDAHPEWRTDWTLAGKLRQLQRPFNWAAKKRLIPGNPFQLDAQDKDVPRRGTPRRPITEQEYELLIEAAARNKRLQGTVDVLRFMGWTGCRPGEVAAFRWDHIDLDRGVIVLPLHKTTKRRDDRAPRVIQLFADAVKLLEEIRSRDVRSEYVFLRRGRKPWSRNGIQQNVKRLREQIGLPNDVVLYGIRHQFGTRGVMVGVDLKTLSKLMGHTTTRMTEHYLHLDGQPEHLAAAMRRINERRPGV